MAMTDKKLAEIEERCEWAAAGNGSTACEDIPRLIAALRKAQAVVEAARKRRDVWTRETLIELDSALAAYDASGTQP